MIHERLRSLELAPLRFHLTVGREFRLPAYKGAIFRGGFGQVFREITCITRAPTCDGCLHRSACGYSRVFETPVIHGEFEILTKYTNAPHPFVLTPPLDERTVLPEASSLILDLLLINSAREWFPHFIFVFDELGRKGRYGGPYRIERVSSLVHGGVVFDGSARKIVREPATLIWPTESRVARRVQVDFITPLRMRTKSQYNTRPDFVEFIHALLGRLHLLTAIYGRQSTDRDWMRDLLAMADVIKTDAQEFRVFRWERTSGRDHRRIAMDGVIGNLTASGDLTPFLPVLRAGEFLHVGSGTSMGLGKYRVAVEG